MSIRDAIAGIPERPFDAFKYPVQYAVEHLAEHHEIIPRHHYERALQKFNAPIKTNGKLRQRSADKGLLAWHAFRWWCEAEGENLQELAVLLADQRLARLGIRKPS